MRSRGTSGIGACVLAIGAAALAGCRQDMHDQPKMYPLRPSAFFADGRSARPLVEGTVARGFLREDTEFYTGKGADGQPLQTYPFPITAEALARGQQRFNIYCSPCHARTGTGNGMIVQRGYRRPPSFHIDRLRQAPPGYFYDVMTNGFGAMPDYATQITPADRWAVAAYVKVLQYSQNVPAGEVPSDLRSRVGDPAQGAPAAAGQDNAAAPGSNLPPPTGRISVPERPETPGDRK